MATSLTDYADTRQPKRRIRISAFPLAAFIASSLPTAADAATIETILYTCESCASYNDLLDYLNSTNNGSSTLGDGIIPGFVSGYYAIPGQTKLLVVAKRAPLSFYFNYTATSVKVPYISAYYYRYTFTPTTTLPASDDGAISQDFSIFKALRASGLPDITLPKTNPQGEALDYNFALLQDTSLTTFISYNLFTMQGLPKLRTLPGILNRKWLPSVAFTYKGKYYVVYEGDTLEVKLHDGTKVELTVTTGTAPGTPGYLKVQKISPPPGVNSPTSSVPSPSTAPPSGQSFAQFSILNPLTYTYDNSAISTYMAGYSHPSGTRTPSITILIYDETSPTVPIYVYSYDSSTSY